MAEYDLVIVGSGPGGDTSEEYLLRCTTAKGEGDLVFELIPCLS